MRKGRLGGWVHGELAAAGSPSPCRLAQAAERRSTAGWWEAVEPNGKRHNQFMSVRLSLLNPVQPPGFPFEMKVSLIAEVSSVTSET